MCLPNRGLLRVYGGDCGAGTVEVVGVTAVAVWSCNVAHATVAYHSDRFLPPGKHFSVGLIFFFCLSSTDVSYAGVLKFLKIARLVGGLAGPDRTHAICGLTQELNPLSGQIFGP